MADGNSVLLVDHDTQTLKEADLLIEIEPEGGEEGGRIVATGTPEAIRNHPESVTGRYL